MSQVGCNHLDRASRGVRGLLALWALVVVGGLAYLARYSITPGAAAEASPYWPSESRLVRPEGRAALIMFVHPRCPCSRASLEELARIVARCPEAEATVVFIRPAGTNADFVDTDLYRRAMREARMAALIDVDGSEARRFGVTTSGHVLLYDAEGRLAFSGGVTPGRGHAGDSIGKDSVISLLQGGEPAWTKGPVFGCPMWDDACAVGSEPCQP